MAQHFLLSAQARTLSLAQIFTMSDEMAFDVFKQSRWSDGNPVCPSCGVIDNHYFIRTRQQWRCKACRHTFSLTSGTIFAHHKLPLKTYIAAIAISTNAVKGISALQMARDLDVQYKTAFVLAHKIRESLMEQRDVSPLPGKVEIDGAYTNGHVRPENRIEDRKDRRLAENQNPNKRCVIVMRERGEKGRALTFVLKSENQGDIKALAGKYILKGTQVFADECPAYNPLHGMYPTSRVNHGIEFKAKDGANTNQAESFFSRFRRMQIGQNHKFGTMYLANYANEAAYRENNRRMNNGAMFRDIMKKCAASRPSRDFCGYWQGNKRRAERLAA
ncbi:MAG: IS1595 family transposase [Methylomagnum sp.]